MKQTLFILFMYCGLLGQGQNVVPERRPMNVDSFRNVRERINAAAIGKPYPSFNVTTGNATISDEIVKGKTVFINVWFAACAPCIAEMEELNGLYERFKGDSNFAFVSFTFESAAEIEKLKIKYNIKYDVFSVPKAECYKLNLNNGFPTSLVLNSEGKIKYIFSGGFLDKKEVKMHFVKDVYPVIRKEL